MIAARLKRADLLLALLLIAATAAVYLPVTGHHFVNYDDYPYVVANPRVRDGLTRQGIVWAFTSLGYAANWHPLAWLSHMLDVELFGLAAGGHHLTSLLLHLGSTALLFLFLLRASGSRGPSALVAALFALHPLHVEAVAWVAERKEVLCAFFWMLTALCWIGWLRRPGRWRYLRAVFLFALALLAKPMAVSLPFVLLLLDWWPLGRLRPRQGTAKLSAVARLIGEKIPFFILAGASGWLTWLAQRRGGAIGMADLLPLGLRVANAVTSYAVYLGATLLPTGLAPYYPFPVHSWSRVTTWRVAAAGLLILLLSTALLGAARRRPYLGVGWLWYLGTLVPVIGLVQVGMQSRADRYTYLPLTGIFILAGFGAADLARALPRWRTAVGVAALLVLTALAMATRVQEGYWRDTFTLFGHTIRVTENNWMAHNILGKAWLDAGRKSEAEAEYREALRIQPGIAEAHLNLGTILMEEGRAAEAVENFVLAARARPDYWQAHYNLGNAYGALGRTGEAEAAYREAIRIDQADPRAWNNLGALLHTAGRMGEAAAAYGEALRRDPGYADAHYNLGLLLAGQGRSGEAVSHYREALRRQPDYPAARRELERLTRAAGDRVGAP